MDMIFLDRRERATLDFNNHLLFQEKILEVYRHVAHLKSHVGAGFFSHVDHLDPKYAEFMAQAYLAIYRQTIGQDARVPAFPELSPDNTLVPRMKEARSRGYVSTHKNDGLRWQWDDFCKAYHWPYLEVCEYRRGYALVKVKLQDGRALTSVMRNVIAQTAHQFGISIPGEHPINLHTKYWHVLDTGFDTTREYSYRGSISPDDAHALVSNLVQMLRDQGHFSPVDESWHE